MRNIRTLGVVLGVSAIVSTGLALGTASAGTPSHTLRLTAVQLGTVQTGNKEVTTSRDLQSGHTTGFDVVSCDVNVYTHRASCDAAVGRADGMINAHVIVPLSTGKGNGKITGGTRAFKNATGTISIAPGSAPNTKHVTLVYKT